MDMAEAFTKALGKPDPAVPPALRFESFNRYIWEENAQKLGAGFFRNRFLYLFGAVWRRCNPVSMPGPS